MKNYGAIELSSIIVASTAHMSEKDASLIESKMDGRQTEHSEDSEHWTNALHILGSEHAYLFSMASLHSNIDADMAIPDWLRAGYDMCLQLGVLWLMFDKDGMEIEGLQTYDW